MFCIAGARAQLCGDGQGSPFLEASSRKQDQILPCARCTLRPYGHLRFRCLGQVTITPLQVSLTDAYCQPSGFWGTAGAMKAYRASSVFRGASRALDRHAGKVAAIGVVSVIMW